MRATCHNILLLLISNVSSENQDVLHSKHSMKFIWSLLDVFDIKNPGLFDSSNVNQPYLMKQFSQKDVLTIANTQTKDQNYITAGDLIVFFRSHVIISDKVKKLQKKISDSSKMLLVLEDVLLEDIQNLIQLEINQEVYIYETITRNVFESYNANHQNVSNQLGYVNELNEFVWIDNIEKRYLHKNKVTFIQDFTQFNYHTTISAL